MGGEGVGRGSSDLYPGEGLALRTEGLAGTWRTEGGRGRVAGDLVQRVRVARRPYAALVSLGGVELDLLGLGLRGRLVAEVDLKASRLLPPVGVPHATGQGHGPAHVVGGVVRWPVARAKRSVRGRIMTSNQARLTPSKVRLLWNSYQFIVDQNECVRA